MRCVDQYMIEWDAQLTFDAPGGLIEDVAVEHEHVTGDQCDPGSLRILDDHRSRPKFSLLADRLVRTNPAADDHRIVSDQSRGRCANLQFAGGRRSDHAEHQA